MNLYVRQATALFLVVFLVSCTTASGLGDSARSLVPKSSFITNPDAPTTLGLSAESAILSASLDALIPPGGEGSWYREAQWDEYIVTIRNPTRQPVQVEAAFLVDPRGVYVSPESEQEALVERTEKLAREYGTVEWAALGLGAVALTSTAGLFAAAAAAPVVVVAGPAYWYWRRHVWQKDMKAIERELNERSLPSPMILGANGTITASLFFPLVPSPRELVFHVQQSGKKEQMTISLDSLKGLHLGSEHAPSSHPTRPQ